MKGNDRFSVCIHIVEDQAWHHTRISSIIIPKPNLAIITMEWGYSDMQLENVEVSGVDMYGYEELDKSCTYSSVTYETEVVCQGLGGFRGIAGRDSFITLAEGNIVKVMDTDNGNCFTLTGHKAKVLHTVTAADGRLLSAAIDGSINIWNPFEEAPAQWLNYLSDSRNNMTSMSICRDEEGHIVATTKDGYICCWRLDTYMHQATVAVDGKGLFSCATSTRYKICAIGGYGRIYVHDNNVSSMSHLTTLGGHTGPVTVLTICDLVNGCIVSGGEDKSITVHRLDTFDMLYTRNSAHASAISCLEVCEDTSRGECLLISGSRDSFIRVWRLDMHTLDLMYQIQGHNGVVTSLYMAPSLKVFGHRMALISTGSDKKLRLWRFYRILNWNRRQAFMMCLAQCGFITTITYGRPPPLTPDVAPSEGVSSNVNHVFRSKRILRVIASFI